MHGNVMAARRAMHGNSGTSLVAAVQAEHSQRWSRVLGGAAAVLGTYKAYDMATRWYAQLLLGSAATEQLYMQQLKGTVELEICIRPFSRVGELRGLLTPVSEAPHVSGPIRHRAFTLSLIHI